MEVPRNKGVDLLMLLQTQKLQKSQRLGQANSQEGRLWFGLSLLLLPNSTGIKKQLLSPPTPTPYGQQIYSFSWHFPFFQTTSKAGGILSVTISFPRKLWESMGQQEVGASTGLHPTSGSWLWRNTTPCLHSTGKYPTALEPARCNALPLWPLTPRSKSQPLLNLPSWTQQNKTPS